MRTFNQSQKSKKALKKEAKKKAMAENGQDSQEYGDEGSPGNGQSS